MCSHLASTAGLAVMDCDVANLRVEGLVEGIRMVEVAARRTRGIEAGPLLHAALNMINGETEELVVTPM